MLNVWYLSYGRVDGFSTWTILLRKSEGPVLCKSYFEWSQLVYSAQEFIVDDPKPAKVSCEWIFTRTSCFRCNLSFSMSALTMTIQDWLLKLLLDLIWDFCYCDITSMGVRTWIRLLQSLNYLFSPRL